MSMLKHQILNCDGLSSPSGKGDIEKMLEQIDGYHESIYKKGHRGKENINNIEPQKFISVDENTSTNNLK